MNNNHVMQRLLSEDVNVNAPFDFRFKKFERAKATRGKFWGSLLGSSAVVALALLMYLG